MADSHNFFFIQEHYDKYREKPLIFCSGNLAKKQCCSIVTKFETDRKPSSGGIPDFIITTTLFGMVFCLSGQKKI